MRIRPLAVADRAAWQPLWEGYQRFYKVSIPPETSDVTFARLTGGTEPMGGFAAEEEDGRIVGIVHWILHRSCWTVGDYCYLQDLFTVPERRGRGVGRALIAAVREKAAAAGCSRVWWLTHESNTDAMKLYDAVADKPGFVQYRIAV
jgi:GNAT superfamily N-acetyltransferase